MEKQDKFAFETGREIGKLTAENARLRDALKAIAEIGNYASGSDCADIAKEALK